MIDIHTELYEYERFYLKADGARAIKLSSSPDGWKDDDLDLDRHKQYHGIFNIVSNTLTFYKEEGDYIKNALDNNGINTNVFIIKQELLDVDGEIKWVDKYILLADFFTIKKVKDSVSIKFNSDYLTELIKSKETDVFELERKDSISGILLDDAIINKIRIEGRDLSSNGFNKLVSFAEGGPSDSAFQQITIPLTSIGFGGKTSISTVVTRAMERQSSSDSNNVSRSSGIYAGTTASNMFIVDYEIPTTEELNVSLKIDINFSMRRIGTLVNGSLLRIRLVVLQYNDIANNYTEVLSNTLFSDDPQSFTTFHEVNVEENIILQSNQGAILIYEYINSSPIGTSSMELNLSKENIKLNVLSYSEPSNNLSFMFVHDVYERLFQIITGKKNKFKSNFFGRTDLGYSQTGYGGLIGLISGYWVRAFTSDSERYKSIQISIKDLLESTMATFNLGGCVQKVGFEEIFRVEKLDYFYQDKVVIRFTDVVEEEEEIDKDLYYTSIEVGSTKGGNYENEIGLDEPNTKTNYITPITKGNTKLTILSKVRSDDYGMEIIRRKPMELYPDEDTEGDSDNWYLDCKQSDAPGNYLQKTWEDRLEEIPQGINSPQTYRSFLFTPLRMLFRHGWRIRASLEDYKTKFIKYINSVANSNLEMQFIGENQSYVENDDILINNIDRAKYLPNKITFTHVITEELLKTIYGKTNILVEGYNEDVPNYYFKCEWVNSLGQTRTGYLLNMTTSQNKFTMQLANEKLV